MNGHTAPEAGSVALLYSAQRHAGTFHGEELLNAAHHVASLSRENGWCLLAADPSGERLVGTASAIDQCCLVDTTRRQDGLAVLLVAGMLAGQHGLVHYASLVRSMGAAQVHCAYMGGWVGEIPGCDTVVLLGHVTPSSNTSHQLEKAESIETEESLGLTN